MSKIVNIRASGEYERPKREESPRAVEHPLDGEKAKARLRQLERWLEIERLRQAPNRYQMALDEDFKDNMQWSPDDAAELHERGQAPLVYNWISTAVKWVTGTEKRTRLDYKVFPRSSDDRNESENKTKLLKYISDVNMAPFHRSRAFAEAVTVGIGWLESGIRGDPTEELVFDRSETWRNMLHDSFGDMTGDNWRYVFRQKAVDVDIAEAIFPDRSKAIRAAATNTDITGLDNEDEYYLGEIISSKDREIQSAIGRFVYSDTSSSLFNERERVKLYEAWYRMPERMQFLVGGNLHGVPYDPSDEYLNWLIRRKSSSLIDRVTMRVRCALFIRGTLLSDGPSPYRHNKLPFTPIWGNRRGRDGMPYGMVRLMRDPQEDFNKRMSKALHALSTRRVFMDRGAADPEMAREEAARPDSVFEVTPGMRFELDSDTEVAKGHMEYAEIDARMIQNAGGVTDELMGRKTNAVSGKAIEARQDQGTTTTTDYFDHYRLAFQLHGQKQLSLCEQFYRGPKRIRIIGERRGYDFVELNKPVVNETGEMEMHNDITKSLADFIVSAQDFRETVRQQSFEVLMDMMSKLANSGDQGPMLAMRLMDDVLEFADLPGAEHIIQTIREITGKMPRDKRLSPEEEQQQLQAKQREQAKQAAMEMLTIREAALNVEKLAADVKKTEAEAMQIMAEVQAGGDGAEAMKFEEQLLKIRTDAKKLVDALTEKYREAQQKFNDRQNEIDAKMANDLAIAQMEIASKERIAEIEREAENSRHAAEQETAKEVQRISKDAELPQQQIAQTIAELQQMVKDVQREAQQGIEDAQRAAEKAAEDAADAEKRAAEAEQRAKEAEKLAADAAKEADDRIKESEKATRDELKAQKDDAKKNAEPQQPVVIVVPQGEGGDEERQIDIKVETDAEGRITGYKGTRKTKRAKPKKE